MPLKILVIGGAGYIGSHLCKLLSKKGHEISVIDNVSTGHRDFLKWGRFYDCSLLDRELLTSTISTIKPDIVMHFAAFIEVGESVSDPEKYYVNNVTGTINLLQAMKTAGTKTIIFSSTAAVYGVPSHPFIKESHSLSPLNPYGKSKLMMESIIQDYHKAYGLNYVIFRYFNAAGADLDSEVGEDHSPETHLIPNIFLAASGKQDALSLFGDNYDTPDGTCIRDYIHVMDIASAHMLGCEYLLNGNKSRIFNLGNARGFSVKEVIDKVECIIQKKVPYSIKPRREGDSPILVSDASLALDTLKWAPQYSDMDTIIESAWKWFKKRHL